MCWSRLWMHLAKDGDWSQDVVYMRMNLQVPLAVRKFLTSSAAAVVCSCSRESRAKTYHNNAMQQGGPVLVGSRSTKPKWQVLPSDLKRGQRPFIFSHRAALMLCILSACLVHVHLFSLFQTALFLWLRGKTWQHRTALNCLGQQRLVPLPRNNLGPRLKSTPIPCYDWTLRTSTS
jgi:hypothetical protein